MFFFDQHFKRHSSAVLISNLSLPGEAIHDAVEESDYMRAEAFAEAGLKDVNILNNMVYINILYIYIYDKLNIL